MDYKHVDRYAHKLHVDLYTGPQAERADLEICRLAYGSPWVLGSGACGIVYKVTQLLLVTQRHNVYTLSTHCLHIVCTLSTHHQAADELM